MSEIPSLRSKHSSPSALPVVTAILGMSPSFLLRGSDVISAGSALSVHSWTLSSVICRRHLPIWITSGMLMPDGTLVSVNLPSGPEITWATAPPGVAA